MILSSRLLDMWDRCPRRFAFEQKWDVKAISPTGLLYAAVEAAIVSTDPEETAKTTAFSLASQRELQHTQRSAYPVVKHMGYLAGIISVGLREKLGRLAPLPISTPEGFKFEWESGLFQDAAGVLHRICLADHFDDDRLRAEAHSWLTVGELAMLRRPITLHAVIIGPHRAGKRHSAWTKGLLHPLSHQLKFARKANTRAGISVKTPLSGAWEDVWREDSAISTTNWMNVMKADEVYNQLILSREIKFVGNDRRIRTAAQDIRRIIERMPTAKPSYMMHRTSCDEMGRGACPYQRTCYSPQRTTPDDFPRLFTSKKEPPLREEAVRERENDDEVRQDQLITISPRVETITV